MGDGGLGISLGAMILKRGPDLDLPQDTIMVQVDTVVRDRAGRMIDNLKPEDFRVFEDGQEQMVGSYSRDEMPLAIALVIDRSGSVSPYLYELRRIA